MTVFCFACLKSSTRSNSSLGCHGQPTPRTTCFRARGSSWFPWSNLVGASAVVFALAILSAGAWFGTRFDPLGRARAAFEQRQYRVALRAAKDHLKVFRGDQGASLMAARCLTRLGQPIEAEEFYQRAGPLEIDDMQNRAEGLVRGHEPRLAAEIYEEILTRNPGDITALKRLAYLRLGLKQWDKVLKLTDGLIASPSETVAGLTMAGIAYHESKNFDQSVAASVTGSGNRPDA